MGAISIFFLGEAQMETTHRKPKMAIMGVHFISKKEIYGGILIKV